MRHPFEVFADALQKSGYKPSRPVYDASPLKTGKPDPIEIGRTRSNKPIMSEYSHESHSNYTKEDHLDAHFAHKKRAENMEFSHPKSPLIAHHKQESKKHADRYASMPPTD
jgi:hypothetical protein